MPEPRKKIGRPKNHFPADIEQRLSHYASIGMKQSEIALIVGIPETTLHRRFGSLLLKKRAEAKERVLAKQFEAACNGVVPMSIWWGKNYGEQSDKADVTSAGLALKVIVERIG